MMMMIPMMEIQSCKSNDSQENPVRDHHTVSIVSRASCLIQYEPEVVIDSIEFRNVEASNAWYQELAKFELILRGIPTQSTDEQ